MCTQRRTRVRLGMHRSVQGEAAMSERVEGSGAAVASHGLVTEERQELERLRAEVAALRAAPPPTA